jgi:hypothetical protein
LPITPCRPISAALSGFRYHVPSLWRHSLRRRSQKDGSKLRTLNSRQTTTRGQKGAAHAYNNYMRSGPYDGPAPLCLLHEALPR